MQDVSSSARQRVTFGVFELDLRSGELRKAGARISLPEQPFRVLALLLEQPGQLVTREELRARLWAAETFVDFEHGLNAAVKRLRDALGDSADTPRFVETLPRRGYRFIAPVDGVAVGYGSPGNGAAGAVSRSLGEPAPGATVGDIGGVVAARRRAGFRLRPWMLASLAAGVTVLVIALVADRIPPLRRQSSTTARPTLTRLEGPPGYLGELAFSPDGAMLAAVAWGLDQRAAIWVRPAAGAEWRQVAATNMRYQAWCAWAPDSRSVLYPSLIDGSARLRVIDVQTGAIRTLDDPTAAGEGDSPLTYTRVGGAWSRSAGLLIGGQRLRLVSVTSGTHEDAVEADASVKWQAWPSFLPDGTSFIFTQDSTDQSRRGIFLGRTGSRRVTRLLPVVGNARVSPSGHLLYARGDALMAAPFDLATERLTGDPWLVASGLPVVEGFSWISVSPNDEVAFATAGTRAVRSELILFDRTGKRLDELGELRSLGELALSADARRIAVVQSAGRPIDLIDVKKGPRVTVGRPPPGGWFGSPAWSPDGRRIAATLYEPPTERNLAFIEVATGRVAVVLRPDRA